MPVYEPVYMGVMHVHMDMAMVMVMDMDMDMDMVMVMDMCDVSLTHRSPCVWPTGRPFLSCFLCGAHGAMPMVISYEIYRYSFLCHLSLLQTADRCRVNDNVARVNTAVAMAIDK